MTYSIKMILHYLGEYKKQYILLGLQMTLALALIFVVRSSEISLVKQQNAPTVANKTGFIVNVSESADAELLRRIIDEFVDANVDRNIKCLYAGDMYIISSTDNIDDLYDAFKSALAECGEGFTVRSQNTAQNFKDMGVGIENISNILRIVAAVISAIVVVGFTGFVMLMLLRREHDMLAAYLCGVSLKRLLAMCTVEIAVVGVVSAVAATLLGSLLTPLIAGFGATGMYTTAPQMSAVGSIIGLLLVIYAVPVTIFAVRISRYNPLVQIRMEEN